jgi:F420-non-reducing hydrogenase iron-sulfur subunit
MTDAVMEERIEIAEVENAERKIVAFFCRECAYAAADAAGNARVSLPPTIRSVLVPCTGRVSPLHLLKALADGADGVYVAGCLEGQCHYRVGNLHAIDRVEFARARADVHDERRRLAQVRRRGPQDARDDLQPASTRAKVIL